MVAPAWLARWGNDDNLARDRRKAVDIINAATEKLLHERHGLLRSQESKHPSPEAQAVWDAGHQVINKALWALQREKSLADPRMRAAH